MAYNPKILSVGNGGTSASTTINAALNLGINQKASSTPGIDGTSLNTITPLFTVPNNVTSFIITEVVVRATTATGIVSVGSVSIGTDVNASNIVPASPLTSLSSAGQYDILNPTTGAVIANQGDTVQVKITTAFVATTIILTIELIGYYI